MNYSVFYFVDTGSCYITLDEFKLALNSLQSSCLSLSAEITVVNHII